MYYSLRFLNIHQSGRASVEHRAPFAAVSSKDTAVVNSFSIEGAHNFVSSDWSVLVY